MDLLSVVMHELGHVLGFDHDDAEIVPLMNGTLYAGEQYQPAAGRMADSLQQANGKRKKLQAAASRSVASVSEH